MKILALAATNHKQSINRQLVDYTTSLFTGKHAIKTIDLNDYEMPLFSPERLEKNGLPTPAQKFTELTEWADLVIISFAEYNGSYTPVFKNLLDWVSTTKQRYWEHKDLLLMATSPGGRGAQSVLGQAITYFPFMGANIEGTFSLPYFQQNFRDGKIVNEKLDTQLKHQIRAIENPVPHQADWLERTLESLSPAWVWLGYILFGIVSLNGLLGSPWFAGSANNIFWQIAMFAATFTLIIRPLYDLWPQSKHLESMLKWRKGVGLVSSGIVVGFWISRNIDPTDIGVLWEYFSADKWSFSIENLLERTSEITALILFLISNKWLVLHANRLWRQLQKLAYVYFLSAALLLTIVHQKPYGAFCLVLFFFVYQLWIYARLMDNTKSTSTTRKSQAS